MSSNILLEDIVSFSGKTEIRGDKLVIVCEKSMPQRLLGTSGRHRRNQQVFEGENKLAYCYNERLAHYTP
ncbi:MAG: hypothetical protein WC492_03190 [Candidatus Micrarchaeia archaeon]